MDERILWRYNDPGIENGASDQAYRAAEGTADFKRCISREAGEKKLEEYLHKNQKARARLMEALLDDEEVEYSLISQKLNITLTVVRALEEQGFWKSKIIRFTVIL